VSLCVKY